MHHKLGSFWVGNSAENTAERNAECTNSDFQMGDSTRPIRCIQKVWATKYLHGSRQKVPATLRLKYFPTTFSDCFLSPKEDLEVMSNCYTGKDSDQASVCLLLTNGRASNLRYDGEILLVRKIHAELSAP